MTKWTGLFCGNFFHKRGPFPACQMAWHRACYRLMKDDSFPISTLADIDDVEDPSEEDKYKHARNGDNFSCPFQCDLCHFHNIQIRDPDTSSVQDRQLMTAIRRANLDAFWARAPGTISNNRGDLKKLLWTAEDDLGIREILPVMGPHPLEDNWGMGLAAVLLRRTLDAGNYAPNIQFETARKIRSAYTNLWGSSKHALTLGVIARD